MHPCIIKYCPMQQVSIIIILPTFVLIPLNFNKASKLSDIPNKNAPKAICKNESAVVFQYLNKESIFIKQSIPPQRVNKNWFGITFHRVFTLPINIKNKNIHPPICFFLFSLVIVLVLLFPIVSATQYKMWAIKKKLVPTINSKSEENIRRVSPTKENTNPYLIIIKSKGSHVGFFKLKCTIIRMMGIVFKSLRAQMSVTYPKSSKHMMPMIKPFILSFVKYSFFILRIYINYKLVNINSININAKCSDSCQYLVSDWLPFSSLFFVDIYFNISSTIFIVSK